MNNEFFLSIVNGEPNIRTEPAKGQAIFADEVDTVFTVNKALDEFDADSFQLVIADGQMPCERQIANLFALLNRVQQTSTFVVGNESAKEFSTEAMRPSAFNFKNKPADFNLIREHALKAVDYHRRLIEDQDWQEKLINAIERSGIDLDSQAMQKLLTLIRQFGTTDATVMTHVANSTGSVLIVTANHDQNNHSANTFPAANISTSDLPAELSKSVFAPQVAPARTLAEITEAAEQAGIKSALIANDHHRELTAKSLGISVRTLHYKMSKYGLH